MISSEEVSIMESLPIAHRRILFSWFSKEDKNDYIAEIVRRARERTAPMGSIVRFRDGRIGIVVEASEYLRTIWTLPWNFEVSYYAGFEEIK